MTLPLLKSLPAKALVPPATKSRVTTSTASWRPFIEDPRLALVRHGISTFFLPSESDSILDSCVSQMVTNYPNTNCYPLHAPLKEIQECTSIVAERARRRAASHRDVPLKRQNLIDDPLHKGISYDRPSGNSHATTARVLSAHPAHLKISNESIRAKLEGAEDDAFSKIGKNGRAAGRPRPRCRLLRRR